MTTVSPDGVWIPGHEGRYWINDQGAVVSFTRKKPRQVKAHLKANGYMHVSINHRMVTVHRLVLLAFVGEPPEGTVATHIDGDRTNNALSNLAWRTHSDNIHDMRRHGTNPQVNKRMCPSGHLYAGPNLITTKEGHRRCRACVNGRQNARYRNRKKD